MEDIQRRRFRKIGVFCGSHRGRREVFSNAAIELGEELVKRKIDLVYEGRNDGLMRLISKIVYDAGFHVLGFIPKALKRGEILGDVSVIADMHQRKAAMAEEADAFIALPGGYETMDDLMEMIKLSQLSIHNKMVGIVNVGGYYDGLLSLFHMGVEEGFINSRSRIVISAPTAKELMENMEILEDVKFTWRNIPPFLLSAVLSQYRDICWAIAFTRQLEFRMKLKKLLPVEEYLSVQELINVTPQYLRDKNGGMLEIYSVVRVLAERGTVLEKYRPLTEFLGQGHTYYDEEPLRRYRPRDVYVYCISDEHYRGYEDFHGNLCRSLEREGCLAIRIPMCYSYNNLKYKDIYHPSEEELDEEIYGHILLAVGYDYDLGGDLYYECQDTGGVEWCDEGYVRISAKVVTHYVEMVV